MNRRDFAIDHIDPRWKEGRDYQLVCGLDEELNFNELSVSLNSVKNNRFLPWKVSSSEIGSVPVDPGDLCLFLDPYTEEWVLEEFLGDWWMEKTWKNCGLYRACNSRAKQWETFRANPEILERRNKKIGETVKRKKKEDPTFDEERIRKCTENNLRSRKEDPEKWKKAHKQAQIKRNRKVQCTVTGYVSTTAGLTIYQRRRGIEPSPENRMELS